MVIFLLLCRKPIRGPYDVTATNHCYFYNKLIIEFFITTYIILCYLFQVVVIVMAHYVMFINNAMAAYMRLDRIEKKALHDL